MLFPVISATATAVALLVLFAGAAGHLRAPTALEAALRDHRTVPPRVAGPLAIAVTAAEGATALIGTFALLSGWAAVLRAAMAGAAVLLLCYAGYALHVSRTRPGVACGCSGEKTPMTGWVAARAGVLALLAVVAAAGTGAVAFLDGAELAEVILAGAVFGVLVWELPALLDPAS